MVETLLVISLIALAIKIYKSYLRNKRFNDELKSAIKYSEHTESTSENNDFIPVEFYTSSDNTNSASSKSSIGFLKEETPSRINSDSSERISDHKACNQTNNDVVSVNNNSESSNKTNGLDAFLEAFKKRNTMFQELINKNNGPMSTDLSELSEECQNIIALHISICDQVNKGDLDSAFTVLLDSFVVQERQSQYKDEIEAVFFSLDKESMDLAHCLNGVLVSALHDNPVLAYGFFVIMKHIFVTKYRLI